MSSDLQSLVAALQFNNYLSLVITTAVTYDYIITLPNETHYIWNRPWTFVSFMFILVRYVGLTVALIEGLFGTTFISGPTLFSLDESTQLNRRKFLTLHYIPGIDVYRCTVLLMLSDWAFIIFLVAADLMMILRVYAMYNKSRIVLGSLLVLCAITITVYATSAAMYDNPNDYLTMTNPQVLNMSFCAPTYATSSKLGRYKVIPRLALAALLFILVVTRLCMESFQMYKATNRWRTNQYLNLLVMEGVLYFLVHLLNNINFGDSSAGSVTTMVVFVLMFILSPRFIMNVRELYLRQLHYGNGSDKGIDSGFGVWDSRASQLPVASLGCSSDVRTPGVAEGDMEMQRVERDINDSIL